MLTMLFPTVHRLGFRAGQAVSGFVADAAALLDGILGSDGSRTLPELLSDHRIWGEVLKACGTELTRLPGRYKAWWWNLVAKDPLHVVLETFLLVVMLYMMLSRSTEGYKDSSKDKLSVREQEELLWEWKHKTRAPLAPPRNPSAKPSEKRTDDGGATNRNGPSDGSKNAPSVGDGDDDEDDDDGQIVVQKQEGKWLTITVPLHWVPGANSSGTGKAAATEPKTARSGKEANGSKNSAKKRATSGGRQQPKPTGAAKNGKRPAEASPPCRRRREAELRVLNFGNFDFLGLQTSEDLRGASTDALNHYGCGSCGPRGFYGTIDAHLDLEDEISRFCRTEQAILYSDGASACTSAVAAFAKRGDVLVVDEGVYEPLATGVHLSRATVHWFQHNDMEDLERVLKELQATDRKLGRKPGAQRRFIVVEGLYKNMGTIAPLDEIVALKHKYHYRLMLDESFSFGTLGETGRGSLEAHGKRPMYDSEITTIALENALGSIGGVTVGNEEVIDHQRLSGAGYCFSASSPPFTASAAVASLKILEEQPDRVRTLQSNVAYTYQRLLAGLDKPDGDTANDDDQNQQQQQQPPTAGRHRLVVTSDARSPIIVLQLERESVHESSILRGIMRSCLLRGIGIVASTGSTELAPCLRMTVSALHTREDTDRAIGVLLESAAQVTARYPVADN